MPLEPELIELMVSEIGLLPPANGTGGGMKGDRTFGPPVTAHAHLQYGLRQMTTDPGSSKVSSGMANLDGVYTVTDEWGIKLPAGSPLDGKNVIIVDVEQLFDETGPYATVVHFGAR